MLTWRKRPVHVLPKPVLDLIDEALFQDKEITGVSACKAHVFGSAIIGLRDDVESRKRATVGLTLREDLARWNYYEIAMLRLPALESEIDIQLWKYNMYTRHWINFRST